MSDNPARASFPFHLGGPGTMTADKQFSIYVSKTLDFLGKNQDMVKYRVKMTRKFQEHYTITSRPFENIIAGSKAEGLTSLYESDTDFMIVFPDVICADNVRPFIHNRNTTVFQTDRHASPAGYTKLKLVKHECSKSSNVIKYSLLDNESEDQYLSSDLFVANLESIFRYKHCNFVVNRHERSGPSLPVSDETGDFHEDKVFSLRCICPMILQSFLTRPRPYIRRSCNELRDISVMDAHVVPVGRKGSNESHNEWRICFTNAEIYLVQILNETEIKLYIILKMVSKLLKFISKDITSYIMKNIVLWLVELYPVDIFIEELLTYQLIQALRFLHKCVEVNFLPSYMIPERNLFADRLDPVQKIKLTTFLSTLIQERGYLLLRCVKLRDGMTILYREPDMAEEFRKRRDMVEKLYLIRNNKMVEDCAKHGFCKKKVHRPVATDEVDDMILDTALNIICPEWRYWRQQGCSAHALVDLFLKIKTQLLS